jgi:hypothetical protein
MPMMTVREGIRYCFHMITSLTATTAHRSNIQGNEIWDMYPDEVKEEISVDSWKDDSNGITTSRRFPGS